MKAFVKIALIALIIPVGGLAATETPAYVMCKLNSTVRTIRVERSEGAEECTTKYTKSGVDTVVGSGRFDNYCQSILNNIKGNLEEANWQCRDITKKVDITYAENKETSDQ